MKFFNVKRIFFITDTHFGVRNNSEDWMKIQKDYFFNWFIPLVKKNYKSGDVLFHLGDVFDSRQSLNLKVLNLAIEIFEELSKIFVDGIFIICGNHDVFGKMTNDINSLVSLKWIPNLKIFKEPETIILGEKKVFLMPWMKDHNAEKELLSKIEEHDYMFCHTNLKGLMFNKFTRIDEGLEYEDLNKIGKVYSGHIHYSQTFGKFSIIGSPYQMTRSDSDNQKGITLLDIETGKEEFFENDYSPKFIKINFEKILDLTVLELNEMFKNNFVDILIDSEFAIKIPLNLLTDYITSPLKITFVPINSLKENNIDEELCDLEGKNFSILDLVKLYLKNTNYEDEKKDKIYKALEKLFYKVFNKEEKNEN